MTLTFRDVKGSRLTAAEFDANTRDLDGRITTLEVAPGVSVEFTVVGGQLYATVNGGAEQGPFDIPTIQWNFRSDGWLPETVYAENDVFAVDYVLYRVPTPHTSGAVFDPGESESGADFYEVLVDLNIAATTGVSQYVTSSDANITAGLSYANAFVECTNSSVVVTVPTNATAAHVLNTEITFCQAVTGSITFAPAVGVTIDFPDTIMELATDTEGAVVTLKKLETNRWRAYGLLASASSA